MNKTILKTFAQQHKTNAKLVFVMQSTHSSELGVDDCVSNGFIKEIEPSYKMTRDLYSDGSLKTTKKRRFIPTEKGMMLIKYELL